MSAFKIPAIEQLDAQLTRGPLKVRRQQVGRLEELVAELVPERLYPYDFLFYRITRYRPREDVRESYPGAEVLPDLLTMLQRLSGGAPAEVSDVGERIYSVEEVAQTCHVSVRTVRRWKHRGLAAALYQFADGGVRMGVRESVLARFVERNAGLVKSSAAFSRVSPAEEAEIVRRARRYADQESASLTAVAARIAEDLGRAPETVRLALLRHDRDNPGRPIFGASGRRARQDVGRRILAAYLQGVPVEELSRSYSRSRSTIYRIINQERATDMLTEPPSSHVDEGFASPGADGEILGEEFHALLRKAEALPDPGQAAGGPSPGSWRRSPLTKAEEVALLRAYNYAKHSAAALQRDLNPRRYVPSRVLEEIHSRLALARRVRDLFLRIHAPLAEHTAQQHTGAHADAAALLAQAKSQLAEAVDSFDYRGPARFVAHANLELLKFFARQAPPPGEEPRAGQ